MMPINSIFIDTNTLIYSTNTQSPFYNIALSALSNARQNGIELVISVQILREFLASSTRLQVPLTDILSSLQMFKTNFRVLEDNLQVFNTLENIVQNISVGGRQIYDANIVATMLTHNISHLLTHNVADFNRFSSLVTVMPLVP
jgi:predicted nucleic acid-binding protein